MEPRKSKALIITFIVVLALLIVGYFLITKGGIIKSDSAIGKKFAPILGTPKQKDVIVDTNNGTDVNNPPAETPTEPTNTPGDPNLPTTPGSGGVKPNIPKYVPPNLSLPKPNDTNFTPKQFDTKTQCADGKDNDNDTSIDAGDADCHYDKNAKNASSYVASYNFESGSKNTDPNIVKPDPNAKKNISCDIEEVPLVFTAEEQAQLDELTREFYRLAPQLKTENDIVAEVTSYQGYLDIISNAKDLSKQCWDYTTTPQYLTNDIDSEVIGQQKVHMLNKAEQNFLDKYGSNGENATFNGRHPNQVISDSFKEVNILNSSIPNKGRTERLPTPYYDPMKEYLKDPMHFYKAGATHSFFQSFFVNTYTNENIYTWAQWENIREVW